MVISFKPRYKEPILSGQKIHTLRFDKGNRWSAGRIMHMATGVRTKFYNCFKVATCISVQSVDILCYDDGTLRVFIDGRSGYDAEQLAKNDGFQSVEDFKKWFFPYGNGLWVGKIIH